MSLPWACALVLGFGAAVALAVVALYLLTSDRFWGAGWP